MTTRAFSRLRKKILSARRSGLSWRKAALSCGITTPAGNPSPGLAQLIAEGYEPRRRETRIRLGLSSDPRPHRRLMISEMSAEQARAAFENRSVMQ